SDRRPRQTGCNPALWDRGDIGLVRRRDLLAAEAGGAVSAAAAVPATGARGHRHHPAWRGAAIEHDPESGYRFSEKIMLNQKGVWIPPNCIAARQQLCRQPVVMLSWA